MGMMDPLDLHDQQEKAAYQAAFDAVRMLWDAPKEPAINPTARIGSLSKQELGWIVALSVSQWICERARQAVDSRVSQEELIRSASGQPEPWEMGAVKACLPKLGDVVEDLGIADKPVGAWSREEIGWFVWSAFRMVEAARVARDEMPSPVEFVGAEQAEMLAAG